MRCLLATLHADVNSFDYSASTLRDFIEFENIELSFAADITFFPRTDVAVNWTPSFEAEFDPENVFRVLKQQVIDQAEDYMSVSACVLACLRACVLASMQEGADLVSPLPFGSGGARPTVSSPWGALLLCLAECDRSADHAVRNHSRECGGQSCVRKQRSGAGHWAAAVVLSAPVHLSRFACE